MNRTEVRPIGIIENRIFRIFTLKTKLKYYPSDRPYRKYISMGFIPQP
jgi:hypothetical protein